MSKRTTKSDDDRFRVRAAPPRQRNDLPRRSFVAQVLASVEPGRGRLHGRSAERLKRVHARGRVGAAFAGAQLGPRARRVVVKLRLVRGVSKSAMGAHLRYIQREGVMRDGAPGQAYGPADDAAKVGDFGARCADDRHHFRLIVAPEDAAELEDLRTFTRQFMRQMEADLQTPLDWVAVDHWDTDNPHTHIAVRGKDAAGENLVIDREYISHGMRKRACELATDWLGLRTEREIRTTLERDVSQARWTGLDRLLVDHAAEGQIDLQTLAREPSPRRELLVGRLQALETMGLARKGGQAGRWQVSANFEPTLRALGERGDIIRTMQRAFTPGMGDFAIFDPQQSAPVVGRVAAKGLGGEFADQPYIVIDGSDGRAYYVRLHAQTDLEPVSVGGIYEARAVTERAVDRNIAALARNGVYRTDRHLDELRARTTRDQQEIVDEHVRRLEALRRPGIVERLAPGVWRVPADLPQRGLHYDQQRLGTTALQMRSHLSLQQQVRALGATWLDQQLVAGDRPSSLVGFGSEVRTALAARSQFLIEQGLAQQQGERILLQRNLLSTLRQRELDQIGKAIAVETGTQYRAPPEGARAAGVYRRSLMLASGRFALLEDGRNFSLVPWRPVIDAHLGRRISAVIGKDHVSWELGRGLSR